MKNRNLKLNACIFVFAIHLAASAQIPHPEIAASGGVWPQEIPTGSEDTMIEVRGSGFTVDTIIEVEGQNVPTDHTRFGGLAIPMLIGVIPESLLREPRLLHVRVVSRYGGASIPLTVEVKQRRQPAKLEISLSTTSASKKDRIKVSIRLTNLSSESFYVPTKVTPFTGGNMLNSYHFEVKRPNEPVFTDSVSGYTDGMWLKKPTEEEIVASGQIKLLAPNETYSGKAEFHVDGFSKTSEGNLPILLSGDYSVRMRFDPQYPSGADAFKVKFLSETLLSNSLILSIHD